MPRALAPRSPPPEADVVPGVDGSEVDPQERIESLLAHLGTRSDGLSSREAERRLTQFGRNEITRTVQRSWPVVSE
jgi:Cation transporter/ATPase, N-terminus